MLHAAQSLHPWCLLWHVLDSVSMPLTVVWLRLKMTGARTWLLVMRSCPSACLAAASRCACCCTWPLTAVRLRCSSSA